MYQLPALFVGLVLLLFSACSAAPTENAAGEKKVVVKRIVPKLKGSPVVFGDGTYPRANSLSDGSIIGVYTGFSDGYNIIKTVRSTDGGKVWKALGSVVSGLSNATDIDNPYVLQLPSGEVLCAFRNHDKDPSTGAYTLFRITVSVSSDKGKSWKYLSTVTSDPGPITGNWEPFLRNAEAGLQIYYSRENSKEDQDSIERFSADGGATWSEPQTISGTDITSRDGMVGVTAISGCNLIAVFETETVGLFSIASITSNDDGKTWGNRQTVYTPSSNNTSAGAPQIITVGGTLVVSFQTNEDFQLASPAASYLTNTTAKVITSGDGGKTWGNKVTVGQAVSVWPGLYALGKRKFLMLWDNVGAKAQRVQLK